MYNIRKSITGKNLANIHNFVNLTGQPTLVVGNNTITISNNTNSVGYTSTTKKLSELCPSLNVDDVVYLFYDTTSTSTQRGIIYLSGVNQSWVKGNSKTITQAMLNSTIILYGGYNETAIISNFIITKVNDNTYEPYENPNITIQDGTETSLVGCNIEGNSYQEGTPTPNNPQEVEVVEGINLFDKEVTMTSSGASKSVLSNGIRVTQTTAGTYKHAYFIFGQSELLGKTITLQSTITNSASNNGGILVWFGSSSNPFASRIGMLASSGSTTINIPSSFASGTDRVIINFYSNRDGTGNINDYVDYTNLIISEGTATIPYVPYNNIGVNVASKNLLPNLGSNQSYNGITFVKNGDGSVTVSGIATRNASFNVITRSYSSFEPGTYYLSGTPSGGSSSTYYMYISPSSSSTKYDYGNGVIVNLQANETNIVQILIKSGTNLSNPITFYPMLVKGSTATEYVPYSNITTPIDLQSNFIGKIGSIKDELNIDDLGNVILTKRIGKVVYDENSGVSVNATTNYTQLYMVAIDVDNVTSNGKGISNYFRYTYNNAIGNFYYSNSKNVVLVVDPSITNSTQAHTWLGTHNIEVYYPLKETYQVNLGKANIELNEGVNYITFLTGLDTRNTIEYEADTSEFREKSYSGESNYRANLTIYHNNVANSIDMSQIARITIKDPIIDTTSQIFYLGSFIAKSLTIKFKNLNGIEIASGDKVTLEIGQLINGEYVDIPIGEFYVDELAENYQTTCEIVCNDASVKFKQAVDYSSCFVDNKATIDTILQEICEICDVPLGKYPTTNGDIEIGTFNNTISGKQWISYIAELKGCNAKIDRYGRLTLIPLKQSSKVSINALESSSWNLGEKYSISQVRYYNGSIWYESPSNPQNVNNILYIRNDNPFINATSTLDNIFAVVGNCEIYNAKTANYGDITLDAYDNITYNVGEDSYQTLNDNIITYESTIMTAVENKISTKQQETTTNVVAGDEKTRLKTVETKVDLVDAKVTQTISDVSDLQSSTTEIEQTADALTTRVNGMTTSINDLGQQMTQFNETYEERTKNSYTLWFTESGIEGDISQLQSAMANNNSEITTIKKYIRQESGNIILGEEGSQMKVVISNNRISFYTGDAESAYISQDKLYITDSTILNKLQVGNWETKEDSNHNLNTRWLG